MKKAKIKIIALLVVLTMSLATCAAAAVPAGNAKPGHATPPRLQDDFHDNVNSEWLANTPIPKDTPCIDSFEELQDDVNSKLRADLDAMRDSGEIQPEPGMQNFVEFYRIISNYDARNKAGLSQLKPRLAKIESISSLADFNLKFKELTLDSYSNLFGFSVEPDADNSTINILNVDLVAPFLGSRSYYEEAEKIGKQTLNLKRQYVFDMFKQTGYSRKDAQKHWDNMLDLDRIIVSFSLTNVEASDPHNIHNHIDFDQFANCSENLDLRAIVTDLCGKTPESINVYNPKLMTAIDKIYNEENIEKIKSTMLIYEITCWGKYLTEEIAERTGALNMKLLGTSQIPDRNEISFEIAVNIFSDTIGQYYGKKYLSAESRNQIEEMARKIIAVYRERLLKNDWLDQETITMAVRKLDAMGLNVGWPDKLPPEHSLYRIKSWENGGNLIDNMVSIYRVNKEQNFLLLGKPVDKQLWTGVSANQVNAFYNPTTNSIYLMAAILNPPFYSPQQSESANLGGIGAIVGHEITHAFDSSGSQYDEYGNIKNWWTEKDRAEFKKRTQAMVKLFDGIEYMGIKVDGDFTKTENVADAGGISCALEIVKSLPDGDLDAFFRSWATVWRSKETRELAARRYFSDIHAPSKLRVNIQLGNRDEFYRFYNVKETDGMYIPPERRVKIW